MTPRVEFRNLANCPSSLLLSIDSIHVGYLYDWMCSQASIDRIRAIATRCVGWLLTVTVWDLNRIDRR